MKLYDFNDYAIFNIKDKEQLGFVSVKENGLEVVASNGLKETKKLLPLFILLTNLALSKTDGKCNIAGSDKFRLIINDCPGPFVRDILKELNFYYGFLFVPLKLKPNSYAKSTTKIR